MRSKGLKRRLTLFVGLAALLALSVALALTRASLGAANARVASLQAQASQLQGTLTQTAAQLAAAQAQASSLQATVAAVPTPLTVAVQQVQHEDAWAAGIYPAGQLAAMSAMNYVVGHVSAAAYGYLEKSSLPLQAVGGDTDAALANTVLAAQAGICGQAADTFAAILIQLGYQVRSVQFYWKLPAGTPDSHIAVEVFYGGGWHFFDPTFGLFWTGRKGGVLSIGGVRAGDGAEHRDFEHKDMASFTNLIEDRWFNGNDTGFETAPATRVVLDAQTFTS